mmetsp:Transcript_32471/g.66381  ORF Transcript_32471/g.66381 Transcript_32471/m.66381 type:complete len:81 (-) Transcript_32471:90-332(-)
MGGGGPLWPGKGRGGPRCPPMGGGPLWPNGGGPLPPMGGLPGGGMTLPPALPYGPAGPTLVPDPGPYGPGGNSGGSSGSS